MIIVKPFIKAFLVAGILTTLVGGTVYSRIAGTELDPNKLKIEPKPTEIYDKNGDLMASFYQDTKDQTKYEEIPEEIIKGFVATEDREFFEHAGINVRAIARAAVAVVKAKGQFVQGGSTITQQLVKTIYLHNGKTLERKQEEAIYSTVLEKMMTKEEIITNYLNHIFYGQQSYGVKDAVDTYFGESLDEFKKEPRINRIVKAALIAGMPQSPSELNPYANPEAAKNRRNTVLLNMRVMHYITDDEYKKAINMPFMVLKKPNIQTNQVKYPEFVSYVLSEAAEKLHTELDGAMYSGLKIYTSFDPEMYNTIRNKFKDDSLFPKNASDGTKVQGAGIFLNPNTGEIYALTGGREETGFLQFNRAYQLKRQPGSTIKPLISYGPAIESGKFTPWSSVVSRNGACFGGGYCVKGGSSSERVSMEYALTQSYNVTSVWLLQQVGIKNAREYAHRLGIELTDEDRYLPIALGGISKGLAPINMADAYQAYANGGYRIPAHAIKRMVNKDGEVVFKAPNVLKEGNKVIKPQTAEYMKMMMRSVVLNGTGRNANVPEQFIAGKTGTTEVPWKGSSGNKDIWFVGFGSDFVGAIWMGFDNTDQNHYLNDYSMTAAKMFGAIATEVTKKHPSPLSEYKRPEQEKPEIKTINLTATLDKENKKVLLSWEGKEDTSFQVYRNGEMIGETDGSTFENKKVEIGENYTYQVFGFDKDSDFKTYQSNIVTVGVPYDKPPKSPTNLTVTDQNEAEVSLNWEPSKYATEYELKRNGEIIYTGPELSFRDTNLELGKTYTYELIAKNEYGTSPSVKIEAQTKEPTIETQPTEQQDTKTEDTTKNQNNG